METVGRKAKGPSTSVGGSRLPKGANNMKKVVFFIVMMFTLLIGTGTAAMAASTIEINTDNTSEGYVSVKFNTGSTQKIKLLVQGGTEKYYYNLSNSDEYVNFPLQFGDGTYTVAIYENTTGTKYRKLTSKSFVVTIEDQNQVFLNSIQEINFNEEDEAILNADKLVSEATEAKREETGDETAELTSREIIDLFYNYVVTNVVYDYDKIKTLEYDYLPDINSTMSTGTGICYDYSSLLAAMLRSQAVPAKLVKGYTSWTSVYHAWNEVYLEDEERWVIVDTTYDAYLYNKSRAYSFEKSIDVYSKSKEF